MSGAFFVLWLSGALCLVKAAAFLALYHFDKANTPAAKFGMGLIAGSFTFWGELVLVTGFAPAPTRMVIALSLVLMFILMAYGLADRYRAPLMRGGGLAILAASAVLYYLILDFPRADFLRQILYQTPYALLSLMVMSVILRAGKKTALDWICAGLLVLLSIQFVAKPFWADFAGGLGASPQDYASTLYAGFSIAGGIVFLLIFATVALVAMALDSAATLVRRGERDTETGLLTRSGFVTHASRTIDAATSDLSISFLAIDHQRGAQTTPPVAKVARLIAAHMPAGTLIGRMAEYDFAVLHAGNNLFASRQSLEPLRKAVADLLGDEGWTLSVGIAEREPGEAYPDLLARGLWALGEAQTSGGNRVRLGARAAFGLSAPAKA